MPGRTPPTISTNCCTLVSTTVYSPSDRSRAQLVVIDDVGEHRRGNEEAGGHPDAEHHRHGIERGAADVGGRHEEAEEEGASLEGAQEGERGALAVLFGGGHREGDRDEDREEGDPHRDEVHRHVVLEAHAVPEVVEEQVGGEERRQRQRDLGGQVQPVRPVAQAAHHRRYQRHRRRVVFGHHLGVVSLDDDPQQREKGDNEQPSKEHGLRGDEAEVVASEDERAEREAGGRLQQIAAKHAGNLDAEEPGLLMVVTRELEAERLVQNVGARRPK